MPNLPLLETEIGRISSGLTAAKAGTWTKQSRPMLGSGKVRFEVGANLEAMNFGGIAPVPRLVTKLGVRTRIDSDLKRLKVHRPYHESDQVLNLACNVMGGGPRREDIERLRHDVACLNALGADLIPDPTTAGDFTRRFDEADVLTLMESINAARPELWAGRGRDLLGPTTCLDIEGTLAPTDGKYKEGMNSSCQGIWGYAPLIRSLANPKEVLYVVNRPGNARSHAGAAEWIDRALGHLRPSAPRICMRGDTDFSLTEHFDRWAAIADFIFGMDSNAAWRTRAEALPESGWARLQRPPKEETKTAPTRPRKQKNEQERIVTEREYDNLPLNHEEVGEFEYQPGKCAQPYRVAALRQNISKLKGERVLFDEIRYFFYITTRRDLTASGVVHCAHGRGDQENVIEQLKNGVHALRLPVCDLVGNWAHRVMAALAWNIKSWFAMMMHLMS